MKRAYYQNAIQQFLVDEPNSILGELVSHSDFAVEQTQRDSWLDQIEILKRVLLGLTGTIYFEYAIPRMGKRIDVLLIVGSAIYVLEFKA